MGDIIKFPQFVRIHMLWGEGEFGVNLNQIERATIADTQVLIWFKYGKEDTERAWDLAVNYQSTKEAQRSLHELIDSINKLKEK